MSHPFDSLRSPYRSLDPTSALEKSTSILLGVSQSAAGALKDVGIKTLFDLATCEVFANAVDICLLAESGQGRFAAIGKVPHDILRKGHDKPIKDLPLEPISILSSGSTKKLDALAAALDIASIRDLASWPPYHSSRELLDRVYNPLATSGVLDQEAPADLIPATGQYPTERVQYEVLLFDAFVGGGISHPDATHVPAADRPSIDLLATNRSAADGPTIRSLAADRLAANRLAAESLSTLRPLGSDGPLDISKLLSVDEGYHLPAIGGILTFTQSWYTKGLSLGNLIHSVALAPGESTKIAMIDWSRRTRTSATEAISEDELLDSDLLRSRAINEITSAVAKETQSGSSGAHNEAKASQSGTAGGGAKLNDLTMDDLIPFNKGITSPGVTTEGTSSGESKGTTDATSWSTTSGDRDVSAALTQDIVDRTHQASHSVRNRRASIVKEVSQAESEKITTRTITNYNHMHALTVEYFEVVQLYRTVVELSKADRCIFVPMKLVDFSSPRVIERYRQVIAASGLRGDVRLLSVGAYDHFALFAPLRVGNWYPNTLFNAQRWLGTNVGAPADTVLSFPSSFVFSDVYFDKKTPFDTLVVTLSSGEIVTLPLAVEEVVDTTPLDSSPLPLAPRKATALRVSASLHVLSFDEQTLRSVSHDIPTELQIVVGELSHKIDNAEFSNTEANRFVASTGVIDVQLDAGESIGLTWKTHTTSGINPQTSPGSITQASSRKFDDVRFEAKIGGKWLPIASASSLEVQLNGRGTTTISPAATAPTSSTKVPTIETTPLVGSLHIEVENDAQSRKVAKKLFDERLHEVRIISARKKDDAADFTGRIMVGLFSDIDERSVRPLSWSINVPKDATSVVLLEIQPTATTNEVIEHLMSNQLYYSQAVWRALNPTTIGILLSRYTWHIGNQERPLVELVDPNPVAIAANYLVLRLSGDDKTEREAWLQKKTIKEGSCHEDLIPVPSGGVFAEAVLGRFNSAEKLDITRFWNWQDSPIPIQAPDIAAIQAGSRSQPDNTVPGQLGAPVLNLVNPPALPDPQGMGAVLAAIQNGNMFRDMSGLAATIGLAQAGLAGAQQGASDASTQAGKNAEVAAQLGAKVAEVAGKVVAAYLAAVSGKSPAAGSGGGGQDGMINSDKGISKAGSMLNYGRGMDGRGVPTQGSAGNGTTPSSSPGTGSEGAGPTDGSGVGSTGYAESSAPAIGNERAAYNTALGGGTGGGGGFWSKVPGMTEEALLGANGARDAEIEWARENPEGHVDMGIFEGRGYPDILVLWNFGVGSADIQKFESGLWRHLAMLKGWTDLGDSIVVTGHASRSGGTERNMSLSLERASQVKEWLVTEGGLPGERIQVYSFGSSPEGSIPPNPYFDRESVGQSRAHDRRVEIRRIQRPWTVADYDHALTSVENLPNSNRKTRLRNIIPLLKDATMDDRYFTAQGVLYAYSWIAKPGYQWLLDPREWDRREPRVLVHAREELQIALHPGLSDSSILNAFLALDTVIHEGIRWIDELVARHSEYPMPVLQRAVERWLVARQGDPNSIYYYYGAGQ